MKEAIEVPNIFWYMFMAIFIGTQNKATMNREEVASGFYKFPKAF